MEPVCACAFVCRTGKWNLAQAERAVCGATDGALGEKQSLATSDNRETQSQKSGVVDVWQRVVGARRERGELRFALKHDTPISVLTSAVDSARVLAPPGPRFALM